MSIHIQIVSYGISVRSSISLFLGCLQGLQEPQEHRGGALGPGLELRVELHCEEVGVLGGIQLDYLHPLCSEVLAAEEQSLLLQAAHQGWVHLVPVSVALRHTLYPTVQLRRDGACSEQSRVNIVGRGNIEQSHMSNRLALIMIIYPILSYPTLPFPTHGQREREVIMGSKAQQSRGGNANQSSEAA